MYCWMIAITLPTVQYTLNPDGSDKLKKPIISGIIRVIIAAAAGSMPALGVIFCTR